MHRLSISILLSLAIFSDLALAHEEGRFQLSGAYIKVVCEPQCPRSVAKKNFHNALFRAASRQIRFTKSVRDGEWRAQYARGPIEVHLTAGPTCARQKNPLETTGTYVLYQKRLKKIMCLTKALDEFAIRQLTYTVADIYNGLHVIAAVSPVVKGSESNTFSASQNAPKPVKAPLPAPPQAPALPSARDAFRATPTPPAPVPSTSPSPAPAPAAPAILPVPAENRVNIVCTGSCLTQFSEPGILTEIGGDMSQKLTQLEASVGTPIRYSRKPFEVRLTADETCAFHAGLSGVAGMTFNIHSPDQKALICLNHTPAEIKRGESAFLHESAHHFFPVSGSDKVWATVEELVVMTSTFAQMSARTSCHPLWAQNIPNISKLCERGFIPSMIPAIVRELTSAYEAAPSDRKYVSEDEFIGILSRVIGREVKDVFGK